jgi:hypothetical protein
MLSAGVAGLRDRDFDDDTTAPAGISHEWRVDNGRTWLGWIWERREIENYVIDPDIVHRALELSDSTNTVYREALRVAAQSIMEYTAARYALSLSRTRFLPLPDDWGPSRGRDGHHFPGSQNEADCRQAIEIIVQQYQQSQFVSKEQVLGKFDELLSTCRVGGVRLTHFVTFFAGKDLLYAMEPALIDLGFQSAMQFREFVIYKLQRSADVWTWLPEWTRLRDAIQT